MTAGPISATASYPFNNEDAFEDAWRDIFGSWHADAVVLGFANELQVYGDSTGRHAKVKTGACRIAGTHGRFDTELTVDLATNTSGSVRWDRIVARAVLTGTEDIVIDVLPGVPGAGVPLALTRNASVMEISLATIPLASGYTTVPAQSVFPTAAVANAPVDERVLLGGLGVPTFASAAVRDLWIPSPKAGRTAALLDKGGLYIHDGAAWQQTLRVLLADGVIDDPTSDTGDDNTWPANLSISAAVPKWATRAFLRANVGQIYAIHVLDTQLDLVLGTIVADRKRVEWDSAKVGTDNKQDLVLAGDISCTSVAGTTVTARIHAQNLSSGNALRCDTLSSSSISVEFR